MGTAPFEAGMTRAGVAAAVEELLRGEEGARMRAMHARATKLNRRVFGYLSRKTDMVKEVNKQMDGRNGRKCHIRKEFSS